MTRAMPSAARPAVELLYASDCPNIAAARRVLLRAFALAGLNPHWREWRADDPQRPARLGGFGSPTILVGGRDVTGDSPPAAADCCRIYQHAGTLQGVPAPEQVAAALGAQLARAASAESSLHTAQLTIEGMHCAGCADTIQALLARESGVESARVSFASGEGRVCYDPNATGLAQLIGSIEQAGYRVSHKS